MRWLLVAVLLAVSLVWLVPTDVSAHQPTAWIRVTAQGSDNAAVPQEPQHFLATAVSNYEVEITWTLGLNATHTLVRRQIGSYPSSIFDGVQVYWGTGDNCSDSIDMTVLDDDIYYRAWSWNPIGYSASYAQDIVEIGGAMANALTMFGAIVLLLGLTFGAYHYRRWPIAIIAGVLWVGLAAWAFTTSASAFDLWWFMGFAGICMFIVAIGEPIWMRSKIETEVPKSDEQSVIDDFMATTGASSVLGKAYKPSRRRRSIELEEDDEL